MEWGGNEGQGAAGQGRDTWQQFLGPGTSHVAASAAQQQARMQALPFLRPSSEITVWCFK